MKLWNQAGRGQSVASPPPTIISTFSPSTRSASQHPPPPSLSSATDRKSQPSSYPYPSCFAPSFLLHKITEAAERGGRYVARYPASRPSYSGAQLAAPPLHPIGWPRPLSGSNYILSVVIGAIEKQRLKMNYPVSSSSLMNK